jgi:hypothetical protein
MDYLQQVPLTMCTVDANLVAGTTSTLSNTGTINYCIGGKAYSKAAMTNQATPTTDVNTGLAFVPVTPNTGCAFVIGLNAAGALVVAQGGLQALDVIGNFIVSPSFPAIPDNFCPISYEIIKAGATASAGGWIFGTSNQAAVTGITYSLVELMTLPARPQVA